MRQFIHLFPITVMKTFIYPNLFRYSRLYLRGSITDTFPKRSESVRLIGYAELDNFACLSIDYQHVANTSYYVADSPYYGELYTDYKNTRNSHQRLILYTQTEEHPARIETSIKSSGMIRE